MKIQLFLFLLCYTTLVVISRAQCQNSRSCRHSDDLKMEITETALENSNPSLPYMRTNVLFNNEIGNDLKPNQRLLSEIQPSRRSLQKTDTKPKTPPEKGKPILRSKGKIVTNRKIQIVVNPPTTLAPLTNVTMTLIVNPEETLPALKSNSVTTTTQFTTTSLPPTSKPPPPKTPPSTKKPPNLKKPPPPKPTDPKKSSSLRKPPISKKQPQTKQLRQKKTQSQRKPPQPPQKKLKTRMTPPWKKGPPKNPAKRGKRSTKNEKPKHRFIIRTNPENQSISQNSDYHHWDHANLKRIQNNKSAYLKPIFRNDVGNKTSVATEIVDFSTVRPGNSSTPSLSRIALRN